MFCQRKYIKDEKSGTRGNIHFDENAFMLVMGVFPWVVFLFPSLMFGEILRSTGISQISVGRRAGLRATTSQREMYDENAFICQKTLSRCTKFILTSLPWIHTEVLPLQTYVASEHMDRLVSKRWLFTGVIAAGSHKQKPPFCESHYLWW